MKNLNNDENNCENTTQDNSHSHIFVSPNENYVKTTTTATQTRSLELKRRYCKNARQKLEAYFREEMRFNLATADGCPHVLCDDDIAEKLGVSRWAVYAHRKKYHIPDRDVRMDLALKALFTVTHECFGSIKSLQRILAEQELYKPTSTGIVVIVTAGLTAAVTLVLVAIFYSLFL